MTYFCPSTRSGSFMIRVCLRMNLCALQSNPVVVCSPLRCVAETITTIAQNPPDKPRTELDKPWGLSLTPNQDALLVADSGSTRVRRIDLRDGKFTLSTLC